MKAENFLKNTLALTATSVIINAAGIGFRSYLTKKIGADGIGLYSLVMSVVFFAATVANSGISLSVVRLVSENSGKKRTDSQILCCALSIAVVLGVFAAAVMCLSAEYISMHLFGNIQTAPSMRWFAVSLPFLAVSSSLSGYFMAKHMIKSCVSWQLSEQFFKILLTVIILNAVPGCNAQSGCRAVAFAAAVGEILSCGYGFLLYNDKNTERTKHKGNSREIYADIARISAPTALSSYFRAALSTFENILIPKSFAKMRSLQNSALAEFGILKGMALPVITFPLILMSSATSLLIPELAGASAQKNYNKVRKICRISIGATVIYSVCSAVFFIIFGAKIGILLFNNEECGYIISVLAFSIPFMYLDSLSDAILKSLNEQVASMKYNAAEGIVRIFLIYTLVPLYGSGGFMTVIFASNLISAFLGMSRIYKILNKPNGYVNSRLKLKTVRILGR